MLNSASSKLQRLLQRGDVLALASGPFLWLLPSGVLPGGVTEKWRMYLVFISSPPHFLSSLLQTLKRSAIPVWAHPVGKQRALFQGGVELKLNLLLLFYTAWQLGETFAGK